jgi:hypothetical protein
MGEETQRMGGTSTRRPNEDATKLATWRKSMARVPLPKKGCFKASDPNTEGRGVPCVKAPTLVAALPGGASLGPMPGPLQDRYDTLYGTFADA